MRISLTALRDAYASAGQDSPVYGGLREAFGQFPDKLLSAAASVKIDGSDDANRIACSVTDRIEQLEANVRSETPGIQAMLTDLIAALAQAEREFIELARLDFGAGWQRSGRRALMWRSRSKGAGRQIASR
jgi:hypothetical protein